MSQVTVTIEQLNLEAALSNTLAQRNAMLVQAIGQVEQLRMRNEALEKELSAARISGKDDGK